MARISQHYRLDEQRAKELEKIAEYRTKQQAKTGISKRITKTDILETLIYQEYLRLNLHSQE